MYLRREHELRIQVAALLALHEWLGAPTSAISISVSESTSDSNLVLGNPSQELILALYEYDIDAKPFCQSERVDGAFIDPATGEHIYLLGIQHIQWIEQNEAQVKILYFKGGRSGATLTSHLKKNGETWGVVEQKVTGMF